MSTDSAPAPEEEPHVPEDVWERFLHDSERDIRAGAPKEPSARARIVARRLREEDERAAAAVKRRWGRRPRAVAPALSAPASTAWRTGTTDAGERRARRRSRLRGLVGVVLVVAVVFFVLSPGNSWSFVTGKGWHHTSAARP
jgi:hypothetical protein